MRWLNAYLILCLLILAGCVPGGDKAEVCPSGQTFNQALRACSGSITTVLTGGPVNTTTAVTVIEDTPSIVYLNYTDPNGDLATACTVNALAMYNVNAGACTCSAGVCSFTLTTDSNENSSASGPIAGFHFTYTVTAGGDTSTLSQVVATVTPADDAIHDVATMTSTTTVGGATAAQLNSNITMTVLSSVTVPAIGTITEVTNTTSQLDFTTTNGENITLIGVQVNYLDRDGGTHAVEIINAQNITATTSTCTTNSYTGTYSEAGNYGTCTFFLTKSSDYNGSANVQFAIRSISGVLITNSPTYTISGTFGAVDDAPIALASSISSQSMTEETEKMITLPYSDAEGDLAVNGTGGCDIVTTVNLTETTTCSCSAGVCTVGLTPNSNNYTDGSTTFSFSYNITTLSTYPVVASQTGATSSVFSSIIVANVVDNPIAAVVSPTTFNEDTATAITLNYTDPDVSSATGTTTSCSVSSATNGSIGACTCTLGVCTATFTPTANYSGAASFQYNITRGTRSFTAASTANLTITAVNDAPTVSIASTAHTNMYTPLYIPITIDEGGGADEDTQTLTLTSATPANATLIPATSIVSITAGSEAVLADGAANVSATTWYLKVVPDDNTYGTTSIPVIVSDGTTSATATVTVTVNPIYAVHKGWKNIQAVGRKLDYDGAVLENKYVRLDWENFDIYGSSLGTTNAFNVYRGIGNIDWNTPINTTPIPSTQTYYIDTDSTLTAGTVYQYAVRPVDATYGKPITPYTMSSTLISSVVSAEAGGNYGIVQLTFPPDNMALLHRWAVNKEICSRMSQASDEVNNFRCVYNGPGNIDDAGIGYYDFSGHAFVDIVEMGCNYSQTECGPNGCIGSGNPSSVGCEGAACSAPTATMTSPILFYDRTNGGCYYTVDGSNWNSTNDGAFPGTYSEYVPMNRSNLPPLTNLPAWQAQTICDQRSGAYTERLLRRTEFIAAAAWDTTTLTDASITSREAGVSLNTTSACNSSAASGLTIADDLNLPTTDTDTLPSSTSSTHRTLLTGSTTTASCRSRYGIQDLVGNVREFNTDTVICTTNTGCTGTTATSGIEMAFTTQWADVANGILYDMGAAPLDPLLNADIFSWKISTKYNDYNYIFIPYGLPVSDSGWGTQSEINGVSTPSISTAQLHEDAVSFNAKAINAATNVGIVTSGGSYSNGTQAGRYSMEWVPELTTDSKTGFRCINKF